MKRFILCTALMVFSLAGCKQLAPSQKPLGRDLSPDEVIVQAVNQKLSMDPVTARSNIGVSSSSGVVTLIGRMDSDTVRLRALSIVRGTSGVRGVIDKTFQF